MTNVPKRNQTAASPTTWLVFSGTGSLLGEVEALNRADALAVAGRRWPGEKGMEPAHKKGYERVQRRLERELEKNLARRAYHEAGHAAVGRLIGLEIIGVDLKVRAFHGGGRFQSAGDGHSLGTTRVGAWQGCGEPHAIFALAGPIAEHRYLGRRRWSATMLSGADAEEVASVAGMFASGFDRHQLEKNGIEQEPSPEDTQACRDAYVVWLIARTNAILSSVWPQVEAVAKALMDRRELSAAELDAILSGDN